MPQLYLNPSDRQKVKRLAEVLELNNDAARLLSTYLNVCPDFITPELVRSLRNECPIPEEDAFSNLVIAACGLDTENNMKNRQLATSYITPAIHKLQSGHYQKNPYYQKIDIPEIHIGNWELKYEKYKPYEAFVWNENHQDENFKETPQIGFFDTEFSFPAIKQNNQEWMAIKPNEIETMQQAIDQVSGEVITFGLGLGYYAYMASEKPAVKNITIVEHDSAAIALFTTHLLPQFPNKHKITLIQMDAFEFASQQLPACRYDYAFTDLWHDVSDGCPLYRKMKKLEVLSPQTTFLYWIEDSLLSHLRWNLFYQLYENLFGNKSNVIQIAHLTSITSYEQLVNFLHNSSLKKIASEIP